MSKKKTKMELTLQQRINEETSDLAELVAIPLGYGVALPIILVGMSNSMPILLFTVPIVLLNIWYGIKKLREYPNN